MDKLLENIRVGQELRSSLSQLRTFLREEPKRQPELKKWLSEEPDLARSFLRAPDPKVRRNGALLIGELGLEELAGSLCQAYQKEDTLFVRSDYLKALGQLNIEPYLSELRQRLAEMEFMEVPEEQEKHYRQELTQLQKLLLPYQEISEHRFLAQDRPMDILLTTHRNYREITAGQVKGQRITLVPMGVRIRQAQLQDIWKIRTFRELLFPLDCKPVSQQPRQAAKELAAAGILTFLRDIHSNDQDPFYVRIGIPGSMPLSWRSEFTKKCGFYLEQETQGGMKNTASGYQVELRLLPRREGDLVPLLKLNTWPDPRFDYRQETIGASIHPTRAALVAELARPYLKEGAQILDPLCGVGTMLLERDLAVKAGTMYGIDIYGEAVDKARNNAALADRKIYFIHRDFFDFHHEYLFDEIITNLPIKGRKTREEQDEFYRKFFQKSCEVLRPGGIMVLYSNEKGQIKKQLRLHQQLKLLQEHCISEKDGFSVFVIEQRGLTR